MPSLLGAEKCLCPPSLLGDKRGLHSEGRALRLFQNPQRRRLGILKHALSQSLLTPCASPYLMGSPLFSSAHLLPSSSA